MRPKPEPTHAGQESVWQFPRPAVAEPTGTHIVIEQRGHRIADSCRTVRTLETSHPPSYYIPREDIALGVLRRAAGNSVCEWKGAAVYWDVAIDGAVIERVGWSYLSPTASFEILKDHVAFYARPFDRCLVDGQIVTPQEGAFYGGWITDRFAGPFIALSRIQGAVSASQRRAAMKVCVPRCPKGGVAFSRRPLRLRPRTRVILVVTLVSSMKTRRPGWQPMRG